MPDMHDTVATATWGADADVGCIVRLRDEVTAFAAQHGMPETTLTDLGVAVSEALTNCARHAYPTGAAGDMLVDAAADGECFTVRVADQGAGVGGATVGLGIKIMRGFADRLEIGRRSGGPGTTVVMEFSMSPRTVA